MNFRILAFSLAGAVLVSGAHAESSDSALALSTNNDLFAPTQTERDYTTGVAITYSSNSEAFIRNPVSRASQGLDVFKSGQSTVHKLVGSERAREEVGDIRFRMAENRLSVTRLLTTSTWMLVSRINSSKSRISGRSNT
jgi:hypothetical protein